MSKLFRYFRIKSSYFLYLYFYLFILISWWDSNSAFSTVVYSIGLFLICEYFQVYFDFDYQKSFTNKVQLLDLLPVNKKTYQLAQTMLVIGFIVLNTLLLLFARYQLPSILTRFYIRRTDDVLYFVEFYWIFISLVYFIFHLWATYFAKDVRKITSVRFIFLLATVLMSFITLLLTIPNEYTNRSVISGWASIILVSVGVIGIVSFILFAKYFKDYRKKYKQFKLSKLTIWNIRKLSKLQIETGVKEIAYIGFFSSIFYNMIFLGNRIEFFMILFLSLVALFLSVTKNVNQYFRRGSLLKMMPFTRKEIYVSSVVGMVMDWLLYAMLLIGTLFVVYFFRGNTNFNIDVSLGVVIATVIVHIVLFYILNKTLLSADGMMYGIFGGFVLFPIFMFFNSLIDFVNTNLGVSMTVLGMMLVLLPFSLRNQYKKAMIK